MCQERRHTPIRLPRSDAEGNDADEYIYINGCDEAEGDSSNVRDSFSAIAIRWCHAADRPLHPRQPVQNSEKHIANCVTYDKRWFSEGTTFSLSSLLFLFTSYVIGDDNKCFNGAH